MFSGGAKTRRRQPLDRAPAIPFVEAAADCLGFGGRDEEFWSPRPAARGLVASQRILGPGQ